MKEMFMYFAAFALGEPQIQLARGIAKLLGRFNTNIFDLSEEQDCDKEK
jgi:hypothetical protein